MDVGKRRSYLLELNSYIHAVDNDVTMLLQSLQWDRKHLIEASPMTACQYNQNHRVPPDKLGDHEKECYVRSLGYSKEDLLLPEPLDEKANTLVTFNKNDIGAIFEYAAKIDPGFMRGRGGEPTELLSLERLQHAYSADERRVLHDATVSAAPACHDLGELALLGGDDEVQGSRQKSRAEILAELRDMKRRRAKYRVAAKTKNYSDVLRDVIATQMEHYSEVKNRDSTNNSRDLTESRTHKPQQSLEQGKTYSKDTESKINSQRGHENRDRDKCRNEKRHSASYRDKRRDNSSDDISHGLNSRSGRQHSDNFRDRTRHGGTSREHSHDRDNSRIGTRHRDVYGEERRDTHRANFRDELSYKDKTKRHDDYRRHHERDHERRHKDNRDRYSGSSKDSRDKRDYRSTGRYRDDSKDIKKEKEYKAYKSSKNGEDRYKREDDSYDKVYREDKHKRYYEYKQDENEIRKRIKQEKD